MLKLDLLREIAKKTGISQKDAEEVLIAYGEVVGETLELNENERVPLPGFGTFKAKRIPEREGVLNIGANKGEKWTKPAHTKITFTTIKKNGE